MHLNNNSSIFFFFNIHVYLVLYIKDIIVILKHPAKTKDQDK